MKLRSYMHTPGRQTIIQFRYECPEVAVKHLWLHAEHIVNDFIYLNRLYTLGLNNPSTRNTTYFLTPLMLCILNFVSKVT